MNAISKSSLKIIPAKAADDVKFSFFIYCIRSRLGPNKDRSLTMANLPLFCESEVLERLFADYGVIAVRENADDFVHRQENVSGSKNTDKQSVKKCRSFSVRFSNTAERDAFLHQDFSEPLVLYPDGFPSSLVGMEKYVKQYKDKFIDPVKTESEIDKYMEEYDKKVEEKRKRERLLATEPDEEGWVTVTRKTKKRPQSSPLDLDMDNPDSKKQKKDKVLKNFYSFQVREANRKKVQDLQKKIHEDKQKIADLRRQRKFKPFS